MWSYHTQPAAIEACTRPADTWQKPPPKGKLSAEQVKPATAACAAPTPWPSWPRATWWSRPLSKSWKSKKAVFGELEGIVGEHAVLVTNTSSLSVTAIANGLKRPQQFAGFPILHPAPLMKVVEAIAGLKSSAVTCQRRTPTPRTWATPRRRRRSRFHRQPRRSWRQHRSRRFIGESITDFATVDRILRDQMGFRLGPFELMDLTALDVSHPATNPFTTHTTKKRDRPQRHHRAASGWGIVARKWAKA